MESKVVASAGTDAPADSTEHAATAHIYLSVVIPAYNERNRLPATLMRALDYLRQQPYGYEVIVADDGSSDDTATVVTEMAAAEAVVHPRPANVPPAVRVLALPHKGKAYAVRRGMLAAQGAIILFSDADFSTPLPEVTKLTVWLEDGYDVAIGSREGQSARRIGEPFYRHVMGRVFNLLVRTMTGQRFKDTQCGFKAFRLAAAHDLFSRLRLYDDTMGEVKGAMVTGFDVEVLFLAQKRGYKVREVPVLWEYGERSKVNPVRDTLRMVRDIVNVRLNDMRGVYTK